MVPRVAILSLNMSLVVIKSGRVCQLVVLLYSSSSSILLVTTIDGSLGNLYSISRFSVDTSLR